MQAAVVRIGTRGSPLALAQAREVQSRLALAHGLAPEAIAIEVIKTSGDRILDRPLSEVGGKGLFTKEIEDALLAGGIDIAVHSMKDMQTVLPDGLELAAALQREDARDAFISLRHAGIAALPKGAKVGTSSLRRRSQILNMRPDLDVVEFRGNVQTRLRKLEDGVAEATFLAVAGLNRLGMRDHITSAIGIDEMLPAVAQGAIGLEIRADDGTTRALVAPLDDDATAQAVAAERAFLARLEGSCRTPIAGHAVIRGGVLVLRGQLLSPDGRQNFLVERSAPPGRAAGIGREAAEAILSDAGAAALVPGAAL